MKYILYYLIVIFVGIFSCSTNCSTITKLILDVLIYKNIKFVTFYTCFKQQETAQLNKVVSQLNIRSNFVEANRSRNYDYYENVGKETQHGFILDFSCQGYEKVLHMAEKCHLYQSHYTWLLIDTQQWILENVTSVYGIFSNVALRMDSYVTVAVSDVKNKNESIALYDVYNPGFNKSKTVVTPLGSWVPFISGTSRIVISSNLSKYEQRKNMTGVLLKSAIVNAHPTNITSVNAYYRDLGNKNYDTINKMNYALFIHLQEIHNFTLQLMLADKWFGNVLGGMDGGLAKLLHEKTVDFGATAGLIKADRIPLYDFVAPTYPFRSCFIFRNPGTSGQIQNEFLKPFAPSIWWYILGYILLFCIVLKSAFFVEQWLFDNNENHSWATAYLLTWAVFCQQGATFIPNPTSGRCTLLSLLLMSLLLYNYYTSSIVSSLLSGLPPPFKTIEELTNSDLEIGIEDIVYVRTLFEVTNDSLIKHLYHHKVLAHGNKPNYEKVEEGIRKVKMGGYAYHTEPTTGYPLIETSFEPYEICDLAEINLFTPAVLYVYAQKRSQYTQMFVLGYSKMLEAGIISRQQSIWVTSKPDCLGNAHLVQVGMQHLSPAFLVLLLGLVTSVLLLILEILWHRKKKLVNRCLKNMNL